MTSAAKPLGICALCLTASELQDSHLIPAWAYRFARSQDSKGSLLRVSQGSAYRTDLEEKTHLLCKDCEQRFSSHEDHVSRLVHPGRNGTPLLNHIHPIQGSRIGLAWLDNAANPSSIAYFAASILWRSSIMNRGVVLGRHEAQFREYLFGQAAFPQATLLLFLVAQEANGINPRTILAMPTSMPINYVANIGHGVWLHGFSAAGLTFRCYTGRFDMSHLAHLCLGSQLPQKYVQIQPWYMNGDLMLAFQQAARATPRGKFADEAYLWKLGTDQQV